MAVIYPPVFLHCLQLYHLGSSFKVSRCWDSTETDMAESNPKRHKRWKDSLTNLWCLGHIFAEKFQDLDSVGLVYLEVLHIYMDVSENSGTPKSSTLIGFSIINHPFWGTPIFGNTHIYIEYWSAINQTFDPSSPRLELPTRFQPNHHRGQYSEQSPDGNRAMHRTNRGDQKTVCFPMGKRWLVLSECKGKKWNERHWLEPVIGWLEKG